MSTTHSTKGQLLRAQLEGYTLTPHQLRRVSNSEARPVQHELTKQQRRRILREGATKNNNARAISDPGTDADPTA